MTRRSGLALALARPYVRRRLRNAFDGVFVEGIDAAVARAAEGPLIVAANHVCWWDPLTILAIDERLGTTSHALMDAQNLTKLPFFGWVGAVPLDRTSPRRGLRDMQRATSLIEDAGTALWIFPQGEQRPAHIRPLGLHAGVAWLARRSGAHVVPLSLSYLHREAPQATIAARLGGAIRPPTSSSAASTRAWMHGLEKSLVEGLERCDRFIMSGTGAFEPLVPPQRQNDNVPVAGRLLAAVGGGPNGKESR